MAELKKDNNYVSVSGGITDDALETVQPLRVNATTNYLLTETSLDSEASGSIAVNIVAGALTVSSGTPVSLDWIAGTKLSGGSILTNLGNSGTVALRYDATGSIAVNMVAGSISVATGTPVSIDWVAGTRMSGGSVAVNVLGGTFFQAGGTVLSINAGGTVNAQKYGDWNIDSVGAITSGSIQLVESRQIIGYTINNGGTVQVSSGSIQLVQTPPLTISSGSIQLIQTPPLTISAGSVQVGTVTKLTSGSVQLMESRVIVGSVVNNGGTVQVVSGSGSVQLISPYVNIASGTVGLYYSSGGSISVNVRQLSNGSIQLMDGYHPIGSIAGGTIHISAGSIFVSGAVAHDAANVGNPVKMGAVAETALSGITKVADGDISNLYCGADGVQFVRPHTGLEDISVASSGTVGNGTVLLFSAAGANIKTYITDITISNSYGTMVTVALFDGPHTAKYTIPAPATGGATHAFTVPLPGTANTIWYYQPSITTSGSGSIYVSAVGFKSLV